MEQWVTHRIKPLTGACMILVALLLDVVSILPFIHFFAFIFGSILFPIWFFVIGAPYKGRSMGWAIGGALIGIFPFISILPEMTVIVIRHILITRQEDKKRAALAKKLKPRELPYIYGPGGQGSAYQPPTTAYRDPIQPRNQNASYVRR